MMIKTYNEMIQFFTFEERFEYLKLKGKVAELTFGIERYLNQRLYQSREWKDVRNFVILRDNSCDLGIEGFEIHFQLVIHHINPLTIEDIEYGTYRVFDLNNLITTSFDTHNAIHYGSNSLFTHYPIERKEGDTRLWSKR